MKIIVCIALYCLISCCNNYNQNKDYKRARTKEPPCLEVIYFVPLDQQPDSSYIARINTVVKGAKQYYDYWMLYWGYPGSMRLNYMQDTTAISMVTIYGKEKLSYYIDHGMKSIKEEVDQWYQQQDMVATEHTTLVFTCVNGADIKGVPFSAKGSQAFVIDAPNSIYEESEVGTRKIKRAQTLTGGIYHELGHALGLPHNWGNTSDNNLYGYTLMGTGNPPLISQTYLSKSDCAVLNSTEAFTDTALHGNAAVITINGRKTENGISISGTFRAEADTIRDIVFYNDCYIDGFGDNKDYDASSWVGTLINNDSFVVHMPSKDFRHSYDTTYQLKVGFCLKYGGVKWFKYRYNMFNGAIDGKISEVQHSGKPLLVIILISSLLIGLLFIYYKIRL